MARLFNTNPISLSQLLDEAHTWKMQLPDFQRGWIWDDFRIRDLLTSVAQGFPIGAIMRLDAGGDLSFKGRGIEGAGFPKREPDTFLLDGQQRLTSLYQALKHPNAVDTHNSSKKRVKQWYYVDMLEALKPNRDFEKVIFSVPENKVKTTVGSSKVLDLSTTEREYEQHMIPTERLLDSVKWLLGYVSYWRDKKHPRGTAEEFFKEFDDRIIDSFRLFDVPVIDLDDDLPREAVCIVFDKVNTGGVPLTTFELLTAILAAEGFKLREDWRGRQSRIRDHNRVMGTVDKDQFIRVVALMVTADRRDKARAAGDGQLPAVGCRRSDILSINRTEYEKWASEAEMGFKRAARFLNLQSIFSARDIPYMTQVISLAFICATAGSDLDAEVVRRRLERWYWSGVFGEVYGGTTDTIIANDAQRIPRYLEGHATLPILDEANFEPARLLSLRTRNTAAYKGIHALLMKSGVADWRNAVQISFDNYHEERIDIHHVFPRRWCERESAKALGQKVPPRIYNSAINKTPLSAKTNRIIGGRAPSRYIELLRRHSEGVEVSMAGHHIEADYLKDDDFALFFVERGKELMRLISDAMGKDLSDGQEVFQGALESANLRSETDDYDDDEEDEFILQTAA